MRIVKRSVLVVLVLALSMAVLFGILELAWFLHGREVRARELEATKRQTTEVVKK